MFPIIDNISKLKAVKSAFNARQYQFTPTACIFEAVKLRLKCNNSAFNNKHFSQSEGTAQGPYLFMSL